MKAKGMIVLTLILLAGCATQPAPQTAIAPAKAAVSIPFRVELDEKTKTATSAGEMEGNEGLIVVSPMAYLMTESKTMTGAIRGKFPVGEAFARNAAAYSSSDTAAETLQLSLLSFQQKNISSITPSLEAEYSYKATLTKSNLAARQKFSCKWGNSGIALTPNEERKMLDNMMDETLKKFFVALSESKEPGFPAEQTGTVKIDNGECQFTLFGK